MSREIAAILYVLIGAAWNAAVIGTCTYLVFWRDHSGWWYLLAILLCTGSISSGAAKIRGTWRKEMDE